VRTIKRLLLSAKELAVFILGLVLSFVFAGTASQWDYRGADLPLAVLFSGLLLASFLVSSVRRKHAPRKRLFLVLGVIFSFALVIISLTLAVTVSESERPAIDVPSVILFSGLVFTSFLVRWVRRRHAPQKFAYDVAGWTLDQAEREHNPQRRKCKRILVASLVTLPSLLAAFVLFFFPAASHLRHPGSRYFPHYRVPIPWTITVLFPAQLDGGDTFRFLTGIVSSNPWSRFGMATFWDRESLSAIVTFGTRHLSDDTSDVPESVRLGDTADLVRREFRSNSLALTCWQWRYSSSALRRQLRNELVWNVSCRAPADVYQQRFEASFYGRRESMPGFYKIIEGVAFVE